MGGKDEGAGREQEERPSLPATVASPSPSKRGLGGLLVNRRKESPKQRMVAAAAAAAPAPAAAAERTIGGEARGSKKES